MYDVTNADRAHWAATAIAAASSHPEASRAPRPSAKAGRIAVNAFAAITRRDPAEQRVKGHIQAHEVIGDLVCDLFHQADGWLAPATMLRAHKARVDGKDLSSVPPEVRPAVFTLGNVLRLATSYGLDADEIAANSMDMYAEELAEEDDDE